MVPDIVTANWKAVIKDCLFLSHSPYWFVIDYMFLMVFAPILNHGFEKFSKYNRRLIIIGLILISCYFGFLWCHSANKNGYTILQFITMYCIGREIAISKLSMSILASTLIYFLASLLLSVCGWICWKIDLPELSWKTTYYNDPLLVISSIGLFLLFKNIRFQSKTINKIAKSAFGIYLFQSSSFIGSIMYEWLQTYGMEFGNWIFLIIIAIAILTAIVAIMIDQLRLYFLDIILPPCTHVYKKIKNSITED